MEKTNKPSLKNPEILFVTFFGSGYSPFAPGTMGSLSILLPLYFLGQMKPPFFLFIPFLTILSVMSVYIINIVEKRHKIHDPGWIVIDEVVGMWITTLFLTSFTVLDFTVAFIWFRFFDILKPWPISYFDNLNSAFGTLADDIVAGLMAGASCILTFKIISIMS